jgi:membrane associated rhomboid family serine protease
MTLNMPASRTKTALGIWKLDMTLREENPSGKQPIFNLPPVITAFFLILVAIHLVRVYGLSDSQDQDLLVAFSFIPVRYGPAFDFADLAWLWSPVTYSFLHGGWEHLLLNGIWLCIFGTPVARRLGLVSFLTFCVMASVAAALTFWAFHPDQVLFLMGASGVISALTGAASRFVFGGAGRMSVQGDPVLLPRLSIAAALQNRSVLMFTAVWFLGNVVLSAGTGLADSAATPIAWEAHLGGFLFGFFSFPLFDRIYDKRSAAADIHDSGKQIHDERE